MNIQAVHEKTGLARSTISAIYNGDVKRIENETLEKLCKLFDCQPGDIMEYVPDAATTRDKAISAFTVQPKQGGGDA